MRLSAARTAVVLGSLLLASSCGKGGSQAGANDCGISTQYVGDDACLSPPPPGEGIQVHVGPLNYNDPEEVKKFLIQPGEDYTECYSFKTPNTGEIFYMSWELRGRPGTHHIINTLISQNVPDGWSPKCVDVGTGTADGVIGTLPGASRAHMPRVPVAPEDNTLGIPLAPRAQAQADIHYFNPTGKPILREFWLNLYFVDKNRVTDTPNLIRGMGGLSWISQPIPPRSHQVYEYACPIVGDGRILGLLGHTHAHAIRETAWILRAGARIKVFEQFNYLEPQVFFYNSITQNPDFSEDEAGAHSGILEVSDGDTLQWECEVSNNSDIGLTYINERREGRDVQHLG